MEKPWIRRNTLLGLSIEERFWEKVNKRGDDECWEWMGFRNKAGYGAMETKPKRTFAHRLAWLFSKGNIPDGLYVCHHCDNRACCNPKHLFLGTYADNNRDMFNKNRGGHGKMPGSKNPSAKLNENQVLEIIKLHNNGLSIRKLAQIYSMSVAAIGFIFSGRNWKSVRNRKESEAKDD